MKKRSLVLPADYPWKDLQTAVSYRDTMLDNDDHYLSVGVSAFQAIRRALNLHGLDAPSTILDLPCGHSRVTRVLRAAFPDAKIYVCDIDTDGTEFCSEEFHAEPLAAGTDFLKLDYGKKFELIWVGSLITHLPAPATNDFLAFVVRHLTRNGVAVVSSHGRFVVNRLAADARSSSDFLGIGVDAVQEMLREYDATGHGYADYPLANDSHRHPQSQDQRFGISIASREWIADVITRAGGTILSYEEQVWDNHHDVAAFARGART
ncbi:MAG: hypothetical protein ABS58_08240 [Mesorhizobium sp. SCN 65-20]|nr:MAG: hypothetical protein ABS58_08240 [Mesorhizobium sp. SCN 65-20]